MKKTFLFMLMAIIMSLSGFSQNYAPLSESFEDGIPENWTAITVTGSHYWTTVTSTQHSGSSSAYCQYSSSEQETYLITPKMFPSEDNYTLTLWLRLEGNYNSGNTTTIEVSTGGTNPNDFSTVLKTFQLSEFSANYSLFYQFNIDLSNYIGEEIYVALHDVQDNGGMLWLDDVTGPNIIVPACQNPSVIVNNIAGHSATVTWNMNEEQTYTIQYKPSNATEWINEENTESPFILTELDPETSYQVRVSLYCEEDNEEYISTTKNFTTLIACPAPIITVSNATTETANVSWTGDAETYTLRYKIYGQSSYIEEEITVEENTYELSDLSTATSYQVEVQANCGEEDGISQWGSATFTTPCGSLSAENLPYFWDFESNLTAGTSSNPLPACWTRGQGQVRPYSFQSSNSYNSARALYCELSPRNTAALPHIDADITTLQVTFYGKTTSASSNMIVGLMTDPADTNTFIPIQPITLTNTWELYEVPFSAYEGEEDHVYIALMMGPTNTYVDNLTVELIPSCSRPNNITTNATVEDVVINWVSTSEDFEIYFAKENESYSEPITDYQAGEEEGTWTATISDLDPITTYKFYIKSICGDNTDPQSIEKTFSTPCAVLTESNLPYSCNFENNLTAGTTNNPLPACWTRGTTNNYPYVYNNTNSAHQGSRSLYFYSTNYVALPNVDVDLTQYQLSFYGRSNNNVSIEVGVMTSPTDATTFTLVQSIALTNTYELYEIPLVNYEGEGTYVALRNPVSGYIYIDDVSLEPIPACSRPNNITYQATAEDVTINWVSTGDDFEIYFAENGEEYEDAITDFSAGDGDNTWTVTIDGLESATGYKFYIRVICDDETMLQSTEKTLNTLQIPVELPYSTDFSEEADREWILNNSTCYNYWTMGTASNYSTSALFVTTNGNTAGYDEESSSYVTAEKLFNVGDVEQIHIEFDAIVGGEDGYDYMKVFFAPAYAEYPAATSQPAYADIDYSVNALNFTSYASFSNSDIDYYPYSYSMTNNNTVHISFDVDNPSTDGYVKLVFLWNNDGSVTSESPAALITNVVLGEMNCPTPDFTISNIGGESAVVNLPEDGTFILKYKANTDDEWIEEENITGGVFDMEDLEPGTSYVVKVTRICDDEISLETTKTFNTTILPVDLPYFTDFSLDADRAWQLNNSTCQNYWVMGTPSNYTTPALFVTNNGTSAGYNEEYESTVSAEKVFNVEGMEQIHLEFDVIVGGEDTYDFLKVFFAPATVEYPASTSQPSFADVEYSTYALDFSDYASSSDGDVDYNPNAYTLTNNNIVHMSFDLDNPSTEGLVKLVFVWRNDGSVTSGSPAAVVTNVLVGNGSCAIPNITVSNILDNSVTINLPDDGEYTLRYRQVDEEDWTDEGNINGEEYLLENLETSTIYVVKVAKICEDETSVEATRTFTTACGIITNFPYEEGFEYGLGCWLIENPNTPYYWTTDYENYRDGEFDQNTDYMDNPEGNAFAFIGYDDNDDWHYNRLISPMFDISGLSEPQLKYALINKLWPNDQDTLAVYYRTSSSEDWTYLTGNNGAEEWTYYTIDLPEGLETIQLSFLAALHYGHGIGIDDLSIYDNSDNPPTPIEPTVVTNTATGITQTSATLNGTITDLGNQTITARGFEWKATVGGTYTSVSATGTTMTANLTGLTANTSYTYKAFATTANGTQYGEEVTFTTLEQGEEPCTPATATLNETVCFGETFTFNGNTYTTTGTYTTTVAGVNGECDTNYTINLTVNAQNTATETVIVCFGETAEFNGQTLTEGTNTITVAGQGNECDTLYTVTLTVLPQVTATETITVCYGETAEFNGQTLTEGENTITVAGQGNDCDTLYTVTLVVRPENTNAIDVTINPDELPYQFGTQVLETEGTYTEVFTDINGCDSTVVLTLTVNSSINDVENGINVMLYPNPTTEDAMLRVEGINSDATIYVTDVQGRTIKETKLAQGEQEVRIETSTFASGVYYVRIVTDTINRTEKLIKK